MDLDSRAQYKLVSVGYSDVNFEEYRRILEALYPFIGKILGAQNCGDLQKSQIATFFIKF